MTEVRIIKNDKYLFGFQNTVLIQFLGNKEEIKLDRDIGIITDCLETCDRRGASCLAISLQNERGGRQRCFAHDSSALADQTQPTASTGTTYFEKICVRKLLIHSDPF